MKNVFFALAFMLVGTFAFANTNESLNANNEELIVLTTSDFEFQISNSYFGTCTYSITRTSIGSDGSITRETKTYNIWAASETHCNTLANRHVSMLSSGEMQW